MISEEFYDADDILRETDDIIDDDDVETSDELEFGADNSRHYAEIASDMEDDEDLWE